MARVRTGWNRCQDLDDGSELAVTFRDLFPVPSRYQREPVPEPEPLSELARLESMSKQTMIVPRLPLSEETTAVARTLLMPPSSQRTTAQRVSEGMTLTSPSEKTPVMRPPDKTPGRPL